MADLASKNNLRMKLITIPESFGQVEDDIYRSEMIKPAHFPFIKTLNLSKVMVLSPEPPSKTVSNFFNNQNIEVVSKMLLFNININYMQCHLGQQSWFNSNSTTSWRPISEEIIKEGLQFILNSTNHPILIMCT
jgi:tyrosine-protein phosphatase SIW14